MLNKTSKHSQTCTTNVEDHQILMGVNLVISCTENGNVQVLINFRFTTK